ncbi:hypothetical protein Tco_0926420 [Tanacetum coccineum]|uniref:Uncharacterized protein n=1 Tax=Tanacetum coccineum TaxID=301880 RepID=A0ABQ5DCP0_9ASTR
MDLDCFKLRHTEANNAELQRAQNLVLEIELGQPEVGRLSSHCEKSMRGFFFKPFRAAHSREVNGKCLALPTYSGTFENFISRSDLVEYEDVEHEGLLCLVRSVALVSWERG